MGRVAYPQYEAVRFDKHIGTMTHPFGQFVGLSIFIGIFMTIYEGVVFVISKLFSAESQKPEHTS